jgi:mono/diheme cytochrome c family protein
MLNEGTGIMHSNRNPTVAARTAASASPIESAIMWFAAAILCAVAIAFTPGRSLAQTGKQDFEQHCADCHGIKADGRGTSKVLSPEYPPPDLTHLAQNNGGKFPFERVVNIIDGREKIPSHARIEMPFWGVTMQEPGKEFTPQSNAKVKARIDAIAKFLETLQVH